jgi:hypothetical protein
MTQAEASWDELQSDGEKLQRGEADRSRVYRCAYAHAYARAADRRTKSWESNGPGRDRTCDLGIKSPG